MPSSTNRGNASTLGGLIEETLNLILNDEPEDLEPSDERQDRVRSRFRSTSLGLDDAPRKENRYHEEVRDAREVPSIFDILDNNKRTLRMGYEGHEYILPSTRRHISRPRSIDHTEFANASTIATKGTEPILSKEEEMRNRFMSKDHEGNEEATARQMSFTCKKVGSSIKRESSRGRSRSRNESKEMLVLVVKVAKRAGLILIQGDRVFDEMTTRLTTSRGKQASAVLFDARDLFANLSWKITTTQTNTTEAGIHMITISLVMKRCATIAGE